MSYYENVKKDRTMPSVTNDMKDDDDDDDDPEFVAEEIKPRSLSNVKGIVSSNAESVIRPLEFNNYGYRDDDDDGNDDDDDDDNDNGCNEDNKDGRHNETEQSTDDREENNDVRLEAEQNADTVNISVCLKDVDEVKVVLRHDGDVQRPRSGRKSVTFKNEATYVPEMKSVTSREENELLDETVSQSASSVTPEDSEEEETESEEEVSENIDFPPELVSQIERLRSSGKIEKAALIDFSGDILVRSRGMEINSEDAVTVLRVLKSPDTSFVKIRIGKDDFTCFKNSTSSFIGRADNDFLCASSCLDFVVVGISDPNSPGSCIYEVSRFVRRCYRNSVVSNDGYESAEV